MNERDPSVYIVIPVHNRRDATAACLASLRAQTYSDYHVVLVDDGSTDGTSEFVEENYPEVTIVKGDGNLWWTGATNRGVEYALRLARADDYILTLNNDTLLPSNYLAVMVSLARQAPRALLGSIAIDSDRREVVVDDGIRIKWASAKFAKVHYSRSVNGDSFYSVSVLPGRGTLIPVQVFREIGLFDAKRFPHYAADYDFSLRALRAGYNSLMHPKCYLYSITKLTGVSNIHRKLSFLQWIRSFTTIRSPNNLLVRVRFGLRHPPLLTRPTYILCDLIRVTLGTLRHQIRNSLS